MLKTLFYPKSVALVGASATPSKLGFDILFNLVESSYQGEIYPVNPKADEILGKKVYREVPEGTELVIIAIPASLVLDVVRDCAQKGIKNIVIISAGFKEVGGQGVEHEKELVKLTKEYGLNLVGPNCLGILNTQIDLNASFAEGMPHKGRIALLSQSGAMAVAISDWASSENIGFSKIVSMGNKAGVSENDYLEYLANDSATDVIMLYLESFVDGRKFMKIASQISLTKPIIIFKSGVSEAGSGAVASHTGALAGSDVAVETALKQSGVIRAKNIEDFFDYARVFSMQELPKSNKIAVITNAGGPGVISTDVIDQSEVLEIAKFSKETTQKLKEGLPATANIHNPVDIIGDALANRYQAAFDAVLADEGVDIMLSILTPQVMTEKESTMRKLIQFHEKYPAKPILASFMGGKSIKYAAQQLNQHNVPNFIYPTRALHSLEAMVNLQNWRDKNQEQKDYVKTVNSNLKAEMSKIITRGDKALPQDFVTKLLAEYKIAVPQIELAQNADEAVRDADKIGYPVVMKISSDDVLHKTDAGGVRLALKNEKEVRKAYDDIMKNVLAKFPKARIKGILVQKMYHMGREVIIGMKRDPIFGPLIMFGLGGIYVEVMKDVSFRVAPLSNTDALEMCDEVKAIKLLRGVRGEAPSDIETLAETIVKVGRLALDFPEIKELDINPLMVFSKGEGAVAIDSRFIV